MRAHCEAKSQTLRLLVFDLEAGFPLNIQGFVDAVHFHLGVVVENVGELTSYSLRRVGPSVAGLAELSETKKVALGEWLDKNHGQQDTMPPRNVFPPNSKWLFATPFFGSLKRWSLAHGARSL